jgi:hypothetical protein
MSSSSEDGFDATRCRCLEHLADHACQARSCDGVTAAMISGGTSERRPVMALGSAAVRTTITPISIR